MNMYFIIIILIMLSEYNCQKGVTYLTKAVGRQSNGGYILSSLSVTPQKYNRPDGAAGNEGAIEGYYGGGTTLHPFLRPTTTINWLRSLPDFISTHHYCDYVAVLCLKAHKTGRICAKTVYFRYQTFSDYCNLEYVNCMEVQDTWNMIHTGDCYQSKYVYKDYFNYLYLDDFFLDQYYVVDDW